MKNLLLAGAAALTLFASCEKPAPEQIPADYSKTNSELNAFFRSILPAPPELKPNSSLY